MRKKLFTFLLALVTSVGVSWAQNPSGSCGENVTWELNTSTGTLTITGSGAMEVYSSYYIPWKNYKSSITSVVITDGVTSVSQYSFSQCENLTSVTIGDDVETIGQFTFNDCGSSFTSLTIGNSVQSIGMAAFLNAKWITELTLPSTLQTIGSYALCNLKALATITIPSSVTSIEASAFSGCTALTSIYVEATNPPTMGNDVFASITGKAYIPLYVPNGSVAAYTAAAQWNEFDIHGYDPSDPGSGEEPSGDDPSTGDGSLSGAFTINAYGDQINFSKGNLQYVGSWQFAANQWDIIGAAQADDNRDLFGWGTGDAPNKVSMTLADYAEYHEWGTNMGDGWYTLSRDEWTYLFQTRTNAADLYAPANVNGVNGFVVLPDEWTLPYGMTFTPGVTNYGTNVYQNAGWAAMENAGAVFLPVAGYRYNGNVNWQGQSGFYWSSTVASEGASAWSWLISASDGARRDYYNLYYGMPVRLVKAVVKSDQEFADPVIALIEAIGTVEYTQVCKNRIVEARVAYDHLTDAQKALVSNYSTLTDAEATYASLAPTPATDGSLSGAFTINGDGDQINFSKGNLQYVGSWQFAEDQWSIIGNAQADDNRDLFGWGTGDAPNKVSMTLADYAEYHEWGTNMGNGWYTLSRDEWTYLFQSRTNAANLYAPARVNGVSGFVVLPDEWVQPYGTTFTPGVTNYGTNVYADAAWTSMEDAGAVFLPVAGYRYNGNVNWQGQSGFYWSSTVASEGATAWSWLISASDGARRDYYNLYYGMPVRLVKAAAPSGGSTPSNACGDGLTWELNGGVLTISYDGVGTGEMTDFGYEYDENPVNVAPWKENKSEITTVIVGDGVKSIGNHAFNDLSENFTAVTIANSVERIGLNAFLNAEEITEITLPSSLKTIDEQGFANCGITSITIPSGVTSIGYKAFCYCKALTSLTCEATTPPTLASSVFYKIRPNTSSISSIPLYVPSGSVAAYEAAAQWNAFDIQAIPSAPTYLDADFAIDFRTDPYTVVGGGALPTGVEVEGSMNTGDAQHGYRLPVITIPVTAGNYKVMMGTCKYSNQDGAIKNEDGTVTYATLATNTGVCYHQNPAANYVAAIVTIPSDQIIKVYGDEYTPFFSIEKMAAVPAFTDFEINFRTDPYDMISGEKPAGTVIAGSYNDNMHGYHNVEATVPMQAGTYRLTLGACGYGNGAGNVMSETNVELASFNQKLENNNKCYHQDPANNIVSMIFTVDIDQTITIDCGEYTPYMKLEKLQDNTYYINFENAEGAIGTVPGEIAVAAGESWTIPANLTLYKEGYTFVGWSDGVNTYAPGDAFYPSANGTLQAVYTANSVSIADASAINVKWYFGESNGAPSVTWQSSTGTGYLLAKGEVDGQLVDLKLDIDATSGKFDNAGRGDKWAQVNANTVFSFPSKEGAVVNVETYSGNATYDLSNGTLTCNTNDYYSYLEITYAAPAPTDEQVPTNEDPENPGVYYYSTFFHSSQNYALTNDGTTAFVADLSGSDLVLTKIAEGTQVIPANTAVILRKSGSNEPVVLAPTSEPGVSFDANNDLQGVDEPTTLESLSIDPLKCYVLSGSDQYGVGFYRINGNTLKAHKAYVIYSGNNGPKRMRFVFDTATGMDEVQSDQVQSTKVIENGQLFIIRDGVRYNVQGQLVK